MNPELVICTLDDGVKLGMEFTVNVNKGYVPAAANRPEDAPIGLIPVDSIYSPVRRVSYKVEPTRVGQVTDYDKLLLTVETNGAVTPEDAVALAARILQDQLQLFINFEEPQAVRARGAAGRPAVQPQPAAQGGRAGIVGAQCELPEERQHRLYRRPGAEIRAGDAAHPEFRAQVAERDQGGADLHGSSLGMTVPGWPPENVEDLAKRLEEPF